MATVPSGVWVLAAPASALVPLAPLIEARRARQPVHILSADITDILAQPAAHLPKNAAALLIIAPRRHGPRLSLPGLWLRDAEDREVPVGWLPDVTFGLSIYAHACARVLDRAPALGALAVLGQWEDRFLRVALRTSRWFEQHQPAPAIFHWTADRISRLDLTTGLQSGLGAAIYYGHGRANGWAGYHGVRVADFPTPWAEPIGGLLALCCDNAGRRGGRLSFIEELVLRGVCGGALAAATHSRHDKNRLLGPALCEVLTQHPDLTLAELIRRAEVPVGFWDRTPYRFIGDPLSPLAAASDASTKAAQIFAPAPDAPLPAWENPSAAKRIALVRSQTS